MTAQPTLIGLNLDPAAVGASRVLESTRGTTTSHLAARSPLCLQRAPDLPPIADAGFGTPDIRMLEMPGWPLAGTLLPLHSAWQNLLTPSSAALPHSPASDQLAAVAAAAISHIKADNHACTTIVIPDTMDERAQADLLSALARRVRGDVGLIWLPVAAAIAWGQAAMSAQTFPSTDSDHPIGSILSLHLGSDFFDAALLQCIPKHQSGEQFLVPARDRPLADSKHPFDATLGTQLIERINTTAADPHRSGASSARYPRWLAAHTQAAPHRSNVISLGTAVLAETANKGGLNVTEPTQAQVAIACASLISRDSFKSSAFSTWINLVDALLRNNQSDSQAPRLIGIVVSGALRHLACPDGVSLGQQIIDLLRLRAVDKVMVYGLDQACDPLAEGAAIFQARSQLSLPTYFDTLPSLELLVTHNGKPGWYNLLSKDGSPPQKRQYVPGATETTFPRVQGLAVDANTSELKIQLAMEGARTVRDSRVALDIQTQRREPVELEVKMRPASGFANIEVLAKNATLKFPRRVTVNFLSMNDSDKTKQQVIEAQPRVCPDHWPRSASCDRWKKASPAVETLLAALTNKCLPPQLKVALTNVCAGLRSKDNSNNANPGATAISSDGECYSLIPHWQATVAKLSSCLTTLYRGNDAKVESSAMRCLGYCSSADSEVTALLMWHVSRTTKLKGETLLAIGNCLRDPTQIADALVRLRTDLEEAAAPRDRLNAIAQLCRYRQDGLAKVKPADAEALAIELHQVLVREYDKANNSINRPKKLAINFRNACLAILYLLRFRLYHESFLAPLEPTAQNIKSLLKQISVDVSNQRIKVMLGAADSNKVLHSIINHIDKRGDNSFVRFDADDDDNDNDDD